MVQSKKEFIDWMSKSGYDNGISSTRVGKWYDIVNERHEGIRKILGGVNKIIAIETEATPEPITPMKEIEPFIVELYAKIPKYFAEYGISNERFQYPILKKGNQSKMKWGRHIQYWMTNIGCIPEDKQKEVNKIVSKMGEVWASTKIEKVKMYLNISTSPAAFARLGSYTIDHGSCFAPGGANYTHKFILGMSPNSFVGLVTNDEQEETGPGDNIKTRFWGFTDDEYNAFYTCNIYPRTPEKGATVLRCMELGFANLLNVDKIKRQDGAFSVAGVYFNREESARIYHKPTFALKSGTVHTTNLSEIYLLMSCRKCNRHLAEDEVHEAVDQMYVCPRCASKATYCEYEKIKTFGPTYPAIMNGKKIQIAAVSISNYIFMRDITDGQYYLKKEMVTTDRNEWISKANAEKHEYINCPVCMKVCSPNKTNCGYCSTKLKKEKEKVA